MSSEKNKGKIASSSGTKDDKVGVNPLSTNAADQMLKEETERLTRLLQFYDSLTEATQGEQIATETELSARIQFLKQSMGEFHEGFKQLLKTLEQVQENHKKPRDEEQ